MQRGVPKNPPEWPPKKNEKITHDTGFGVTSCFLKARARRAQDLTGKGTSTSTGNKFSTIMITQPPTLFMLSRSLHHITLLEQPFYARAYCCFALGKNRQRVYDFLVF